MSQRRRNVGPRALRAGLASAWLLAAAPGRAQSPAPEAGAASPVTAGSVTAGSVTASASSAQRAAEAEAYCRHVAGAAAAESALLTGPRVVASFGLLRGSPLDPDGVASPDRDLVLNLRAGVEVSPTRMLGGALRREQAEIDCGQYRAELELAALGRDVDDERPALLARAAVLRGGLAAAEEILARSQAKLDASQTTLQAHTATRLRVEAHRQLLSDTEERLARSPRPSLGPVEPGRVFDDVRRMDRRREELQGQQRRLASVDVTLRGGYNEVFTVAQRLPVFAAINVGFDTGWFWQGGANAESAAAREQWLEHRLEAARDALRESAEGTLRQLQVARQQLAETRASLEDLERRQAELASLEAASADELADYLWFEVTKLRAAAAYGTARVQGLEDRQRRNSLANAAR